MDVLLVAQTATFIGMWENMEEDDEVRAVRSAKYSGVSTAVLLMLKACSSAGWSLEGVSMSGVLFKIGGIAVKTLITTVSAQVFFHYLTDLPQIAVNERVGGYVYTLPLL